MVVQQQEEEEEEEEEEETNFSAVCTPSASSPQITNHIPVVFEPFFSCL